MDVLIIIIPAIKYISKPEAGFITTSIQNLIKKDYIHTQK